MTITLKKLKRAWAFCQEDNSHGKTPFQLSISFVLSDGLKVWLCQDCLVDFRTQFDDAVTRIRELHGD